jgi:hypothetical protein
MWAVIIYDTKEGKRGNTPGEEAAMLKGSMAQAEPQHVFGSLGR